MDELALAIKDVTKEFPGVRALRGISFNVGRGSVHGFLGPNGAGKSTTMSIIAGLVRETSGEVLIEGESLQKNLRKLRTKIGFLPENAPLYPGMRVDDYLRFTAEINGVASKDLKSATNDVIEKCGLSEVSRRFVGNLSKGYKQRVGIAQALVFNPSIVMLDEPTSSLDPGAVIEIRDLIRSLKSEHTLLISTHQLHEAEHICDEVTIINRGLIVQSGSIGEIRDRFQLKQEIRVELTGWSVEVEKGIKARFQGAEIKSDDGESSSKIRILLNSRDELRPEICDELVKHRCGLLSITEKRLDLEEIFAEAVKGETP